MTPEALADALCAKAEALGPGEGFFVGETLVVARSSTGRLWAGNGRLGSVYWWRAPAAGSIRETVAYCGDWRVCGYGARTFARAAQDALERPALRLAGVGTRRVRLGA